MNSLRFTIWLTENDYYEYLVHSTFKLVHSMPVAKRIWNTLTWSMIVGVPIFLLVWAMDGIVTGVIFLGLYMSVSMMGLLRGKRISPLAKTILKRRAKKFASSPANQDYFKPTRYLLSEKGIETSRDGDITITPWKAISYKDETPKHVLLCTDEAGVFILPVDQLGDLDGLKVLLGRCLSFHAEIGHSIEV